MNKLLTLASLAAFALAASAAQANTLGNPGFETAPTGLPGDWVTFSGTGSSAHSTTDPHSGTGHMTLDVFGPNGFAGVFQGNGVTGLNEGDVVTFTGFHKSLFSPFNGTRELKIEWNNGNPQLRVDAFVIGTEYEQFTLSGVTPAGSTGATITYSLSTFGAGQNASTVLIDDFDVSVTPVPEPTTVAMGLVSLLGLVSRRRR